MAHMGQQEGSTHSRTQKEAAATISNFSLSLMGQNWSPGSITLKRI